MGVNEYYYEYYLSAEVISWLNKQIGFQDHATWATWRRFLVEELMSNYQHPWLRRSLISKAKTTGAQLEITSLAHKIAQNQEKLTIIRCVELYLHLFPDGILEKRIRAQWQQLLELANSANNYSDAERLLFVQKYDDHQLIAPIITKRSWWPIIICYGVLFFDAILFWGNNGNQTILGFEPNSPGLVGSLRSEIHIGVLLFSVLFLWFRGYWIIKKTNKKLTPFYKYSPKIILKSNPWQVLFLVELWLLDSLVIGSLFFAGYQADAVETDVIIYSIFKLAVYLWVYYRACLRIPSISEIVRIGEESQFLSTSHLSAEENNQEIVLAETKLQANSHRQEGYMLESAVLGALAFGGSLQVVTADSFNFEYTSKLITSVKLEIIEFIAGTRHDLNTITESLIVENGVQSWICLMSLLCACFFLAVIAIRIQFNRFYEISANHLSQAKFWNEIEDDKRSRLEDVEKENSLIQQHLRYCILSLEKLEDTVAYMDFFRSLGIFSFFGIVFLASIYLGNLGVLLLILIFIAQGIYSYSRALNKTWHNIRTNIEEFYILYSNKIEYLLWGLYALSIIWLSFIDPDSGVNLQNFCIVFSAAWLLFSTIFPDMEVEKWEGKKMGYQHNLLLQWLINKQFRLAAAFFLIGVIFKNYYWAGAGILVIISMLTTIAGSILTPKIKTQNKWFNVFTAITLSMFAVGITFKFFTWFFADYLVLVSLVLLGLILGYTKLNFSVFTGFTKRIIIVYGLLGISILFNTGQYIDVNPVAISKRKAVLENAIYLDTVHSADLYLISTQSRIVCFNAINKNIEIMASHVSHPNLRTQARMALASYIAIELSSYDSLNTNLLNKFVELNLPESLKDDAYRRSFDYLYSEKESPQINEYHNSLILEALKIKQ